MDYSMAFFHYGTIALIVAINAIGSGIGGGLISNAALTALNQQPNAHESIGQASFLGIALIETASIISLTMAFLLLSRQTILENSYYAHLSEIGILCALGITGLVTGIASSIPARAACYSSARQPFSSQKIRVLMLLTQSLMQTPVILGFIIALLINYQIPYATTLAEALRLIASGLCIGIASIGPSYGLALFSGQVCTGIGINRNAYSSLLSSTPINAAIIESPLIFSLLVSFLILRTSTKTADPLLIGLTCLAAALCMGFSTIGTGISSGKIAASSSKQIALTPHHASLLSKTGLFAQALIETSAIYGLVIAIFLITTHLT